ncbi:Uncharacterised protein [Klebsiella pneumoniae]|nr:Uncharacterised protein [Klebsiella pneumoniae]
MPTQFIGEGGIVGVRTRLLKKMTQPDRKAAGGKTALLLDQIANGWAILLNIQHRVAVVPCIKRNVID